MDARQEDAAAAILAVFAGAIWCSAVGSTWGWCEAPASQAAVAG